MKVNYHGVQPPAKGTVVTRDWHLKRVDNSFVNKTFWKMNLIRGQSKTVILTITRNSSQKARDGVFWRKTARDLWLLKFLRMMIDLAKFLEVQWTEWRVFLNEPMVLNTLFGHFQLIMCSLLKESHFLSYYFGGLFAYLRQGLTGQPRLASKSWFFCIRLLSAGIVNICFCAHLRGEGSNSFMWGGKKLSFLIHLKRVTLSCCRNTHFGIYAIFMKIAFNGKFMLKI